MSSSARDKIKSWSGLSEIALIKEVATKGVDIDLCIEYGARKRKLTVREYEIFFHDVVQTYVLRLLSERQMQKAEQILHNVKRDFRCVFFQKACECDDNELTCQLLEYLGKRDSQKQPEDLAELQSGWECLQLLRNCGSVLDKFKNVLGTVNLEALITCAPDVRRELDVELYFATRNASLLPRLDKSTAFKFLVKSRQEEELVRWCSMADKATAEYADNELDHLYCQWPLEANMFEYAMAALTEPSSEALRFCFARAGYLFAVDRDNIPQLLKYIGMADSCDIKNALIAQLPLGKYLLEHNLVALMLCDFVSVRELQTLCEQRPEQRHLLELLIVLKQNSLTERPGFEQIHAGVKAYLQHRGVDFSCEQRTVALYDYLSSAPSPSSLCGDALPGVVQLSPYLSTVPQRLNAVDDKGVSKLPSVYDLLRQYNNVDMLALRRETGEVASFSNTRLCQRYARKYKVGFLHYLKQQRSSFAVYHLITDHLHHYSQLTHTQLFCACAEATELALLHCNDQELIVHCVAFIEMLGFNTQKLRCFLKLAQSVLDVKRGVGISSYANVVTLAEQMILKKLEGESNAFPLAEYEAVMRLVEMPTPHCQLPDQIMRHYAASGEWWKLLVLWQYFDVPLPYIRQHCMLFSNRVMGEHLLRALSSEVQGNDRNAKWHSGCNNSRRQSKTKSDNAMVGMNVSAETMNSSKGSSCNDSITYFRTFDCNHRFLPDPAVPTMDLFAILLLSTSHVPEERIVGGAKFLEYMHDTHLYATSINLLRNAVKFKLPVLSVIATTISAQNIEWHWLVWLAVASDQWPEVVRSAPLHVEELSWQLIETAVRQGHTNTLFRSFFIFYQDNPFLHFLRFLQQTQHDHEFGESSVTLLRSFLLAGSNNEVIVPLQLKLRPEQLMLRIIKLLLIHLKNNFDTTIDQQRFLQCISCSDFCDICSVVDFCQLNYVFAIQQDVSHDAQKFSLDFEALLQPEHKEYTKLLTQYVGAGEYDAAVRLASLLQLPISDIIYSKWVSLLDDGDAWSCQRYEDEIAKHSLPPELLVNFFLYAVSRDGCTTPTAKYQRLKSALTVIKKNHLFPNESFDRDQIEYDMIICYLQIDDVNELKSLDIYHSEYYEEIMMAERCVLYKSFLELKELAGIDDLTVSGKVTLTDVMLQRLETLLNRLLDEGDIVEALRLQELFECRPIDLRFVVFCMALAEDITTVFNMSLEERKLLREVELSSFAKFNRRTLMANSGSREQAYSSSPSARGFTDFSDSASTLEFEEIPSKEKRETLETLQGVASKLKHGIDLGKRIVMAYRAAMYLDKEYIDVLHTKDVSILLKSIAEEGCLHRLLVVSDILTSTHMTAEEIADLLASEITVAVIRPRFYIFSADQQSKNTFQNAELWGHNIDRDLHLFLELTPNTTMLGNFLLDYCDALKAYRRFQDQKPYTHDLTFEKLADIITRYGIPPPASPSIASMMSGAGGAAAVASTIAPIPQVLSHKKQNLIYVELLIKANQCFVHECCMEGIANVLARAKSLNSVLTQAKSWSLLVRMLIGIARYREMYYCFDVLIENDQFESLLGQFDEEKTIGLRQAIIAYLREYHPDDGKEFLKLAALHFLMYKDLAEMWECDGRNVLNAVLQLALVDAAQLSEQDSMNSLTTANSNIAKILLPKLCVSAEVISLLQQSMENYTHATENYLSDNKLLLAQKSVATAEMIAMQLDLAQKAFDRSPHLCVCVINVQTREEFRELVNSELSVAQALILSRSYGYDINWAEALFLQYVILQRKRYLQEYLARLRISDALIHNIVKSYQLYVQYHKSSLQMEEHLSHLLNLIQSITLKYKLASLLGIKGIVMALISDQTLYYLRDTNYGRSDFDM